MLGIFSSGKDAIKFLKQNMVDLVFLDVELPDYSGIEILKQIPYLPNVVFTTSKVDYAYDAFQLNAIDYLKKPFSFTRFLETIEKVKKIIQSDVPNAAKVTEDEDLYLKENGKLVKIVPNDILYIEAVGDYINFITSNGNHLVLSTLKNIAEKLNSESFMKVHRSYIVNIKKIKDIEDCSILIDKHVIPISRSNKSAVMSRIKIV